MASFDVFNEHTNQFPVVIDLPHSGTVITPTMKKALDSEAILANTDWFLRKLYGFLPKLGFTVIQNNMNRYLVDPNRDPDGSLTGNYYHLVYTTNTFGHQLYSVPLTPDQIKKRVDQFYRPYHQRLTNLLTEKRQVFGYVFLIDLHSFAEYTKQTSAVTADIVLGNDFGRTSPFGIYNYFSNVYEEQGYQVSNNFPFRGGYITRHYGTMDHISALQIELRYCDYIEDRFFDEEVVTDWNSHQFLLAQQIARRVFTGFAQALKTESLLLE